MKLGIIGLPQTGKKTLFTLLTGGNISENMVGQKKPIPGFAEIRDNRFDLVITDLRMPNVPGEEVVRYVHEHKPATKVIVISGYSSQYAVKQSVTNGANAFLSKPFSIKELIQTVSNVLGS